PMRNEFAILKGRCFEQDRELPYAPLIDLLNQSSLADIFAGEASFAPLARLVPELVSHAGADNALAPLEPEQAKRQLFIALQQCLTRRLPALVVMEDLQWCDDGSLEFLLYLARRIETQPLLLALTYRPNETSAELHALEAFLATLNRERRALEL